MAASQSAPPIVVVGFPVQVTQVTIEYILRPLDAMAALAGDGRTTWHVGSLEWAYLLRSKSWLSSKQPS